MKRTKMDNSFKLNGISVALIAALGFFSVTAFAAEKSLPQNSKKRRLIRYKNANSKRKTRARA